MKGNELVRRDGTGLAGAPSEARRRMDEALKRTVARKCANAPPSRGAAVAAALFDLLRVCAVHDRPFISRYIRDESGLFAYAQSIRLGDVLPDQYAGHHERTVVMRAANCSAETCPWCGGAGLGSIRCGGCRAEMCYGTTAAGYFRCRASCGVRGRLSRPSDRPMKGVTPFIHTDVPGAVE